MRPGRALLPRRLGRCDLEEVPYLVAERTVRQLTGIGGAPGRVDIVETELVNLDLEKAPHLFLREGPALADSGGDVLRHSHLCPPERQQGVMRNEMTRCHQDIDMWDMK